MKLVFHCRLAWLTLYIFLCVRVCQYLVCLHVLLDVGLLGEGAPTHDALEGLLSGVAADEERRRGLVTIYY